MSSVTKEKKSSIVAEFGGNAKNTGSIDAQIALLTQEILEISNHLQSNKKDFSTNRGLMRKVGQRKRLLT
jgi:small subunit ribosomal protein S15